MTKTERFDMHLDAALVGVFGTVTQMGLAACAFRDGHARLAVCACLFALCFALFGAHVQRIMQAEA